MLNNVSFNKLHGVVDIGRGLNRKVIPIIKNEENIPFKYFFKVLDALAVDPSNKDVSAGTSEENMEKNRFEDIIPRKILDFCLSKHFILLRGRNLSVR